VFTLCEQSVRYNALSSGLGPSEEGRVSTALESLPESTRRERVFSLLVVSLSFSCLALDNTKLSAAVPSLARAYGEEGATLLKWVVEANLLVYASLLLLGGALSERFGPRRMLLLGLAIYGAGSLASAFAGSPELLLVTRGSMGVGGALMTPATLATIKHTFPEDERARAVAGWTASFGVGAALGPVLSGLLLERFGFPAIMLVNLPVVALAFVGALRFVPDGLPRRRVPLDLLGTLLAFLGTAALLFAILEGPTLGFARREVLVAAVSALLIYALLFVWERKAKTPLFEPALFREPRFPFALLVILLAYLAFSGVSFVLTQYLQIARGHRALEAGLLGVPLATSMLVGTLLAPLAMQRFRPERALLASLLSAGVGAALLALSSIVKSDFLLCVAQIPFGAGAGSAFANTTEMIMASVSKERAGTAAAVSEGAFELGGVLGIALLGSALGSPLGDPLVYGESVTRAIWIGLAAVVIAGAVAVGLLRRRSAMVIPALEVE
jgi:DHA2 family multidrug resistance protein-like MFS transporter